MSKSVKKLNKLDWLKMRDDEHPRNELYLAIGDFDGLQSP